MSVPATHRGKRGLRELVREWTEHITINTLGQLPSHPIPSTVTPLCWYPHRTSDSLVQCSDSWIVAGVKIIACIITSDCNRNHRSCNMSNDNYCSFCQVEFHRGRDLHNCIGRVRCGIVKVRARRIPEEEQHFWTLPVSACPPASIWPPMAGSRGNSPKFAAPTPNFFIISLPVQYSQIHCCFFVQSVPAS